MLQTQGFSTFFKQRLSVAPAKPTEGSCCPPLSPNPAHTARLPVPPSTFQVPLGVCVPPVDNPCWQSGGGVRGVVAKHGVRGQAVVAQGGRHMQATSPIQPARQHLRSPQRGAAALAPPPTLLILPACPYPLVLSMYPHEYVYPQLTTPALTNRAKMRNC